MDVMTRSSQVKQPVQQSRHGGHIQGEGGHSLHGYIHPRFEGVASCFIKQLGIGGGALTVYHRNDPVVDIWAGVSNNRGDLWQRDSLGLVFSVTKGIVATLMHMLVSEGRCHYDDPVCHYWPEFARHGKEVITLRQLLCHEAGLYHIRDMIEHAQFIMHWRYMVEALEEAKPIHPPGLSHGYHALTFGWLVGEVIQRITGQPLSESVQQRLVDPLRLDGLYLGSASDVLDRRAELVNDSNYPLLRGRYPQLRRAALMALAKSATTLSHTVGRVCTRQAPYHHEDTLRSLGPSGIEAIDFNSPAIAAATIPAANALCTARSVAKVYAMLANGGAWDGLQMIDPAVLKEATTIQNDAPGRVIPIPLQWRLGYHRVFAWPYQVDRAFGHLGFGGSGAWCDPDRQLSVALIFNNGVGTPVGDLRLVHINHAVLRAVDRVM